MVVTWLRHDWESRHTHAFSLLKEVRLGLVPEEKLKDMLHPDILEITECKELYEQVHFLCACAPSFNQGWAFFVRPTRLTEEQK